MTTDVIGSAHLGDLLQNSVNYARRIVRAVTSEEMSHPTPCRDWDLRALLNHLNDSLLTLSIARETGGVSLDPVPPRGGKDDTPLVAFDRISAQLLAYDSRRRSRRGVLVGDLPLAEHLLVAAGAIEISVHGWDIGQAVGRLDSLPDALAVELLSVAPLVVDGTCRSPYFGPVIAVPAASRPATQLLAYLGRREALPGPQLQSPL